MWFYVGLKRVRMDERQLYVSNYIPRDSNSFQCDHRGQAKSLDQSPTDHNLFSGRHAVWRQSDIHAQAAHSIFERGPGRQRVKAISWISRTGGGHSIAATFRFYPYNGPKSDIAAKTQNHWPRWRRGAYGSFQADLVGVNDQLFLGQKLGRAVPFHIYGVSKITVICWEHGNNDTAFMVVGCFLNSIANRKLRHRELHLESSMLIVSQDLVRACHSNKVNQMDIVNEPDPPMQFGGSGSIPPP